MWLRSAALIVSAIKSLDARDILRLHGACVDVHCMMATDFRREVLFFLWIGSVVILKRGSVVVV